jgi:hypothetical protein
VVLSFVAADALGRKPLAAAPHPVPGE